MRKKFNTSADRSSPIAPHITIHIPDPRWKSRLRPYGKTVRESCEAACALIASKGKRYELSVVLADDAFIRELNKTYRGKDKPTNVLSFPNTPTTNYQPPTTNLGDIILSFDTIAREAIEQGKRFRDHAAHMLVHGVLHLGGYDHESDMDAEKMELLEIKILKKLMISNPYLS